MGSLSRLDAFQYGLPLNNNVCHINHLLGVLSAHSSPGTSGNKWVMGSNDSTENILFLISLWGFTSKTFIAFCIGNTFLTIFLHGFLCRRNENENIWKIHHEGAVYHCNPLGGVSKGTVKLQSLVCSGFNHCSSFSFPKWEKSMERSLVSFPPCSSALPCFFHPRGWLTHTYQPATSNTSPSFTSSKASWRIHDQQSAMRW